MYGFYGTFGRIHRVIFSGIFYIFTQLFSHQFHAVDHKMRTNNDWRVIEPIMKSGNIGELWEMVVIAQNIQVWNPDSLFLTLGSVKRKMAPIQAPIQGPGFQN